jgi:hypothetical protein
LPYPDTVLSEEIYKEIVDFQTKEQIEIEMRHLQYLYNEGRDNPAVAGDVLLFKIASLGERLSKLDDVNPECLENCTVDRRENECLDEKARTECLRYQELGVIEVFACCMDAWTIYDNRAWVELAERYPESPLAAVALWKTSYFIGEMLEIYCSPYAEVHEMMGRVENGYDDQMVCDHDSEENRWKRIERVISKLNYIIENYPDTEIAMRASRTIEGIKYYFAFRYDANVFINGSANSILLKLSENRTEIDDSFFNSVEPLLERLGFQKVNKGEYRNSAGSVISVSVDENVLIYQFDNNAFQIQNDGTNEECPFIINYRFIGSCGEIALLRELMRVAQCEIEDTKVISKTYISLGLPGLSNVFFNCKTLE